MNGVLKLSDVATVTATKHVVGFEETDADEFLDERLPLALQTGFVGVGQLETDSRFRKCVHALCRNASLVRLRDGQRL